MRSTTRFEGVLGNSAASVTPTKKTSLDTRRDGDTSGVPTGLEVSLGTAMVLVSGMGMRVGCEQGGSGTQNLKGTGPQHCSAVVVAAAVARKWHKVSWIMDQTLDELWAPFSGPWKIRRGSWSKCKGVVGDALDGLGCLGLKFVALDRYCGRVS